MTPSSGPTSSSCWSSTSRSRRCATRGWAARSPTTQGASGGNTPVKNASNRRQCRRPLSSADPEVDCRDWRRVADQHRLRDPSQQSYCGSSGPQGVGLMAALHVHRRPGAVAGRSWHPSERCAADRRSRGNRRQQVASPHRRRPAARFAVAWVWPARLCSLCSHTPSPISLFRIAATALPS